MTDRLRGMPDGDDERDFVEFSHPGGHLVARVAVPSIGQGEAPTVRDQIAGRIAGIDRGRCFVLDLSQVSLISSLGLGTCVDLRNTAEKAGLRPVAFGLNRHLVDLFRLMRIDRLYEMPKSQQELDALLSR